MSLVKYTAKNKMPGVIPGIFHWNSIFPPAKAYKFTIKKEKGVSQWHTRDRRAGISMN